MLESPRRLLLSPIVPLLPSARHSSPRVDITTALTKLIAVTHRFYSNDGFSTPLDVQILIDAVSEFVHETSGMGLPSPVRIKPNFQSTPITKNSVSHMETSTTDKVLDERLEYELKDHLWTADDSFFDHFFPEIPDLPLPQSPFPAAPTEARVV